MFLHKVILAARKAKGNRSPRKWFEKYLDDLKINLAAKCRKNESQKSANSKLRADGNSIKKAKHTYTALMIEFCENGFKCGYLLLPAFSRVWMWPTKCVHIQILMYANKSKHIEHILVEKETLFKWCHFGGFFGRLGSFSLHTFCHFSFWQPKNRTHKKAADLPESISNRILWGQQNTHSGTN